MTQSNDTYNGWTNYETWNVILWINNDEHEQTHWLERSKNVDVNELAGQLSEYYRYNKNPLVDKASMYSDLLGFALDNVNWREIAGSLIEGAQEILDN